MNSKTIGAWLVVIGVLFLTGYAFYEMFEAGDIPLFVKIGIAIVIVGIVVLLPAMLKEAKKDKVVVK